MSKNALPQRVRWQSLRLTTVSLLPPTERTSVASKVTDALP